MESSKLKGKTVKITVGDLKNKLFKVDDYTVKAKGKSWQQMAIDGEIVAINYAIRARNDNLPEDGKVLSGLVDGREHLFHEIEVEVNGN